MAKVISANNIQSCAKCTNTSEPIGNETSISRLLVSRHYSISSKVNLEFTYDNGESKEITLAIGDEVSVKYTDDSGVLREVVGTITDIRNKEMSESFKSNTSMGNGNYILQFKIDASEEYGSNVLSVYLINIYDIEPAEIDPGEEPVVSPIAWKEEEAISVKDGLLNIPYNRVEAGKVELVVSYGEDVVAFKEEFDAESANENATFSWSLRSFESLKGTSIEGLSYDEDGNYVYHNGDNDLASEVRSIDEDDTKIIPAGTPLNIEISHFDSVGSESKITQVYIVTEEDVAGVTLGSSSTTPDEPEEEVKTYTVTSTVINGTVDNETLTVNEGEFATVVFTSDEGYDLVNITINGENTGYTGEVTEDNITVTIDNITEDKVIIATFSKSEEEEPVVPTTYTISNIVTNGTVDNETLTVNEGESATIIATPNEGYDQVEVTVNGVSEDISIVDNTVTITIDNITENKDVTITFSKTPVTYTITSNVTDGTVDKLSQTITEGETASVVFTPNEGYDQVEVTVNGEPIEASIIDGTVIITIDSITEDKTIVATFSKTPITYTVNNTVANGTVDNETLTVNEGESATVVFTPEEGYDQVEVTINGVTEDISIVDGLVTVTIDSITEDKTIVATFSKTEVVPITATASIVDGNAVISVANNTDKNINATVIVTSSSDEEVYRYNIEDDETEAVPANGSVDVTWNLRKSISGTEEEVYYAENGNDYIVEAGEYTYTVVYEDDKEVTGTITVLEDDTNAAVNDAIWKYGDVVTTSATDKLMTISYNRLVAGDVQLVVKANDSIVFKEEHSFSTINPNANFTWSMRDFSSLNNTSIEGLTYDEDGVYVYHNGDNSHDEVHSIDEDNSKLIPAGTVLDITITIGNSVLVEQYTVTEEDVTNLTH